MKKYFEVAFYQSKEIFYYAYTLLFRNFWLLMVVFLVSSIALYGAKGLSSDYVGGIALNVYVRYVFVTELFMFSRYDDDIISSIKSGDIITFLNKPVYYPLYMLLVSFFRTLIKMVTAGLFAGAVIAVFYKTFPVHSLLHFILFFTSLCIGVLLLASFSLIMGIFSFVIEDSYFIRFFVNKLYFLLGGVFFPLDIYPNWLQQITIYAPFRYFFYSPAKFFVNGDLNFFMSYFPIQVMWFFIIFLSVFVLYELLVKKLEINGG